MSNNVGVDESCSALARLSGLNPDALHRFVVGRDEKPMEVSPADLQDPFAQLALREPPPPRTAEEVVVRVQQAVGAEDPRGAERSFLVGEGSQIPVGEIPFAARTIRFVVALGNSEADLILSAFSPTSTSVEVMAWDAVAKGFNYYRTTESGAWVFAGNSIDAVRPDTEGKGPFESHTGGNFIMKELRFPWVHWHSRRADAAIDPAVLEGAVKDHRWVREAADGGTLHGAEVCELQVAIPSVNRWTSARFEGIRTGVEPLRPKRIFQQIVGSPTVNLVSSRTKSVSAQGEPIDLPRQFFVDSETLSDTEFLGLAKLPELVIPSASYKAVLSEFNVRLSDKEVGFQRTGDTFFAFVVPERAFEDIAVVKAAVGQLITKRLAAALLMVDFPNPVFSATREQLLSAVPDARDVGIGPEGFSELIAERIRTTVGGQARDEFLDTWDAGSKWADSANVRLKNYYGRLHNLLADDPVVAFRDWFRLAESRRRHAAEIKKMPIFEFPLLLAMSSADEETLSMREDATLAVIGS
jgi:hypothetical protein